MMGSFFEQPAQRIYADFNWYSQADRKLKCQDVDHIYNRNYIHALEKAGIHSYSIIVARNQEQVA